jgi:chromosome segregation ATPase
MAKSLATKEIVFEAAHALAGEGVEPSILTVQSRIGGGSYTTIKRHLDAWSSERVASEQQAIETPASVLDKGVELGRTLWAIAVREANKETQGAKEAAERKVATISQELDFAQSEIRRMEEIEEAQNDVLEKTAGQLSRATADLTEAQAKAARVPDLEARLAASQTDATAARKEATEKAVEAGRLAGEAESLRTQIREITAALVALKGNAATEG